MELSKSNSLTLPWNLSRGFPMQPNNTTADSSWTLLMPSDTVDIPRSPWTFSKAAQSTQHHCYNYIHNWILPSIQATITQRWSQQWTVHRLEVFWQTGLNKTTSCLFELNLKNLEWMTVLLWCLKNLFSYMQKAGDTGDNVSANFFGFSAKF